MPELTAALAPYKDGTPVYWVQEEPENMGAWRFLLARFRYELFDRLPFAVPSDPVVAARVKSIDAGGGNAFFEYQVPSAVITLKQGFGRLIRSLHDRGLLALLDNRILKKRYGRVFVESLPPYSRTTDLKKVEEFFGADA